ncbi:MAG: hypothetical protein Kow0042_21020 [Calditrichia bacterium]
MQHKTGFNNQLIKYTLVIASMVLVIFSGFSSAVAQEDESLEATLQKLSADAAKKYVSPISSAFGANLNGGWFHRAPDAKVFGLNFEIGLVGMGSFFPDDSKSFSTSGQFRFNENQARSIVSGKGYGAAVEDELVEQITSEYFDVEISGATVVGDSKDSIRVVFPGKTFTVGGQDYEVPTSTVTLPVAGFGDLADMNILPLFAPQLTIGTVYGTQLTFRYLPSIKLNDELGKLKYFGFGIQHNPGIWFANPLPLNVAASFYTQKLEIGSLFKTTTTSFGITASKQFGTNFLNLTPYAGFLLESANMEVTYDYIVITPGGTYKEEVSIEIEGENKSRLTVGLSAKLLSFNLNADYNFGKYNSITAGLTVGF